MLVTPGDAGTHGVCTCPLGAQAGLAGLCSRLLALLRRHPAVGHPEHGPPAGRGAHLPLLIQHGVGLRGSTGGGEAPVDAASAESGPSLPSPSQPRPANSHSCSR